MEKENRQNEIRRLERERCQALRDYHEAAEKLDQIDYQLFELKKEDGKTEGNADLFGKRANLFNR